MRVAVDAMGGDHAPEALVEGALLAKPQCPATLILIGDEARLRAMIAHEAGALPGGIEIIHAPDVVLMDEAGSMAIRRKREASLSRAMRLLADKEVDAVVSAGNSGAIVAAARHFVGLIPGLRRPSLAVPLPTATGDVLLADAGAHAEADTLHLVQSAALAHTYLRVTEGLPHPRVGLLNIGQEPGKGMKVLQRAFALLEHSSLCFVGNIEPHDVFADRVDAAVCDGFVGNMLLKMYEGLSETLLKSLESQLHRSGSASRDILHQTLHHLHTTYHYQNIGGAPLLGVRGTVTVAHGRSAGPAIASAIHRAFQLARDGVHARMAEELQGSSMLSELKGHGTAFTLESLRNKWSFTPK